MTQPFTTNMMHTSSPFVKPTTTSLVNQDKLHTSTQSFLSQSPSTPTLRKIRPTAAKFPRISVCLPGYFHCTSGGCVHQVHRCDGWTHCEDNSDEANCFTPEQTSWPTEARCPSANFRCGDGTCIELDDICDGWFDCKDQSDEMQCSYKISSKNNSDANGCANDEFRCLTGLCIPLPFRCDTIIDCDDKTDEEGCQQNPMPTAATQPGCKPGKFHCETGQCIDQAFVCDGLYDCSDASDEKNCPVGGSTIPITTTETTDVNTCMKTEHMCQNGKCIHQNYVCDGIPDCPNGQEEVNCKWKSTTPVTEKTPLDNCIPLTIKECQGLGYTLTYLPNVFGDESFQEARNRFYHSAIPILQRSCTPLAMTLLCGTIFPFCDNGISKYTCKHICDEVKHRCGPDSILMDSCDWLIDESNWCFAGLNFTNAEKERPNSQSPGTNKPVCKDGFYQCRNSSICLHPVNLCDGDPICPMADDEPENCSCSPDQFRCNSGQCVMQSRRCNGYKDCRDNSDEAHCSAEKCTGRLCSSGQCVAPDSFCNGQFDCDDYSDEKFCECDFPKRQCNNMLCIDAVKWCNREDDCGDNSDEQTCNCSIGEVSCPGGKCIPKKWWCDGSNDCPGGFDEAKCHSCKASEFVCTREYRCINRSSVCDMHWDCSDGEDEALCVSLRKYDSSKSLPVLTLTLRGKTSMVCADNWSEDWASFVCKYLRHKNVKRVELLDAPGNTPSYQQILSKTLRYPLQNYIKTTSSCESNKVVHMACNERVCGTNKHHSIQYQKFIIGGDLAHRYTWPWVASVLYLGEPICGATLISDQWLVTAAHCVVTGMWNRTMVPYYFSIVLGEIDLYEGLMNGTRIPVDRIVMPDQMKLVAFHPHPDIALLHLRYPVTPSFRIKPICMPEIPRHDERSACYLTGWGSSHRLESSKRRYSNYLHEVRMIIRDNTNCAGFRPQPNWEHNLCAGYMESSITGCYGDSGGALMCWEPDNRWTIVGVLSKGRYNCAANSPNVFTKISSMRGWIERSLGWSNKLQN